MSGELLIEEHISPEPEICARCVDLGLPGTIPAGEAYMHLSGETKQFNCCADCWNRLFLECSS